MPPIPSLPFPVFSGPRTCDFSCQVLLILPVPLLLGTLHCLSCQPTSNESWEHVTFSADAGERLT